MCEKCILFIIYLPYGEKFASNHKNINCEKKGQCKPHPLPAVGVAYCRSVCVFLWDGNVSFYLSIVEKVHKLPDPIAPCLRKYHRPPTVMTDIVTVTAKES